MERHANSHEDTPELRLDVEHPSWAGHCVLWRGTRKVKLGLHADTIRGSKINKPGGN